MKKRSTMKPHTIMMRSAAALLVLVLASTSIVTGRKAGYTSADSGGDSGRVAAFVFRVKDTDGHYFDISDIQKPGDSKTFQFDVSNTGIITSEVDEEYTMKLELRGSLPLQVTLQGGEETLTLTASETTVTPGVEVLEDMSKTYTFQAAKEQSDSYTLTVTWPQGENDVKYSRAGIAELVLYIAAQQVD